MKIYKNIVILSSVLLFSFGCFNNYKKVENSKLRFVFLGDTRGDYKAKIPIYFTEKILDQFVKQIIKIQPKPEFVIFNGDMVAKTAYTNSKNTIKRWNEIFTIPIKKAGIKIFITPGNHIIDQKTKNPMISASNYIKRFSRDFPNDNPQNGPGIYKGVSYSFDYKNCHFSTVTSFISHRGKDNTEVKKRNFVQKKKDFEYFINKENRKWLLKDLKKSQADFNIFFTHCPLFPVGPHYKDKKSLHAHRKNQQNVAAILTKNKIDLYLTSHEHMYARSKLGPKNPINSGLKGEYQQVILGSAGAPMTKKPSRTDMKHEVFTYQYDMMIADLTDKYIECNVYDQNKKLIDNFRVYKN
jgi:DNA repair exonuclease SbcCD nuclease subunit